MPGLKLTTTILFCFFMFLNSLGQEKTAGACNKELTGFISDGQEYLIDNQNASTFNVVFYPGFIYRLKLCTLNKNIKLILTLSDEKGNIQFTNNIEANFSRDFNFETLFHGRILIKPISTDKKSAQLLIGYQKIKPNS